MSASIGSLKVYLTGDNKGLACSLKHSRGLVNNFSRSMPLMSSIVAGSLAAIAFKGIQSYTAFDKKLRNVNTIARLNEYQFREMGNQVLAMSTKYGKAGTELADGLYDINSAGFKGAEGMRILDIATRASIGGISEVATASKLITSVLNAYGMNVSKSEEISDILFKTVEKGVVYFADLAQYMGSSMSIASHLKVDFAELTSAFATMTKMGITPSDSGTAINRFLIAMVDNKEKLIKTFNKYGYKNGEVAMQEAGLIGVIKMIGQETKGSATKVRELGFNVRSLKTALSLTRNDAKIFKEVLAEVAVRSINAGSATDAFQQQQKALSFELNRTGKAFTKIGINMTGVAQNGSSLSSILKTIADQLDSIANWFHDNSFQINTAFITIGKHFKIIKVLGEWCFGAVSLVLANFIHNFSEGFATIVANIAIFFSNMYTRTGALIADIWDNVSNFPARFKRMGIMITDIMVAVVKDIGGLFGSLGKSIWEFLKSPMGGFNWIGVDSHIKKTLKDITGGKYNLGFSLSDKFKNSMNVKTDKYEKANMLPSALMGLEKYGLKMLDKFIDIEEEYNKKNDDNYKTHIKLATALVKNTDGKNIGFKEGNMPKKGIANRAFEIKLPELLAKGSVADYQFSAKQRNPLENKIETNTKSTSFYTRKLYELAQKKKENNLLLVAQRNSKIKVELEQNFKQEVSKLFADSKTSDLLKDDKNSKIASLKDKKPETDIEKNTKNIKDVAKKILDVALSESRKASNSIPQYACSL